jgi:hypothetical protein
MIQTKGDPTRYLLMSREPSRDSNSKNKFRWRIIGNGKINSTLYVRIDVASKNKTV